MANFDCDKITVVGIVMPRIAKYWPFRYIYRKRYNRQMADAINSGAHAILTFYGKFPKGLR